MIMLQLKRTLIPTSQLKYFGDVCTFLSWYNQKNYMKKGIVCFRKGINLEGYLLGDIVMMRGMDESMR